MSTIKCFLQKQTEHIIKSRKNFDQIATGFNLQKSVFADEIPRETEIDFVDENTQTGRKEGVKPVFEDIFADTSWDIL